MPLNLHDCSIIRRRAVQQIGLGETIQKECHRDQFENTSHEKGCRKETRISKPTSRPARETG